MRVPAAWAASAKLSSIQSRSIRPTERTALSLIEGIVADPKTEIAARLVKTPYGLLDSGEPAAFAPGFERDFAAGELAPEKWTPRGLLFLTLWRTYEGRTRLAVHTGISGRGSEAGDRGWAVSGGRRTFVGSVAISAGW